MRASAAVAEPLIDRLTAAIRQRGLTVETGRFAAYMQVESTNDGPICILPVKPRADKRTAETTESEEGSGFRSYESRASRRG